MPILVIDYDPNWPQEYAQEEAELCAAIGEFVLDIQHIGSTSVPGLAAKPVIDIMIGVESLEIADTHCVSRIVELGYEYVAEFEDELPFRRYFRKSDPNRIAFHPRGDTHHVHLVEITHPWWQADLAFRDYLRSHPDVAKAYGELKRQIAPHYEDGNSYNDGKNDFIQEVKAKALQWYIETHAKPE